MSRIITKLKVISGLMKTELPIAAGICVILGEILALGSLPTPVQIMLGFLTGFLISGAAMISNDYFDLEADKIGHPDRPLPSGKITINQIIALTILFSAAGLIFALPLGLLAFSLAVVTWLIGILYNWKFKVNGLFGNMLVSLSVAMTFIFGAVSVGGSFVGVALLFGLLAFVFDLGEEIANGALDLEGDKVRSVKSIAILKGRDFAVRLSSVLFGLVVLLTFVPFLLGWLGLLYLAMILATDTAVIYLVIKLLRSKTNKDGHKRTRQLYLCLIGFVIALLASTLLSAIIHN